MWTCVSCTWNVCFSVVVFFWSTIYKLDVLSVSNIAGNDEFYNLCVDVQWNHCQKNTARGNFSSMDRTGQMNISWFITVEVCQIPMHVHFDQWHELSHKHGSTHIVWQLHLQDKSTTIDELVSKCTAACAITGISSLSFSKQMHVEPCMCVWDCKNHCG